MYDMPSCLQVCMSLFHSFAEELLQQPLCNVLVVPYSSVVTFTCLLMIDLHIVMLHVFEVPVNQFFFIKS